MAKSKKKIKEENEQYEKQRNHISNQIKTLQRKLVEVPILCNKCGKSCIVKQYVENQNYGLLNAQVFGGYFSPSLEDDTEYKFSMCEPCLKILFESFVINPEK